MSSATSTRSRRWWPPAATGRGPVGVTAAVGGLAKAPPDELLAQADLYLASPREVGRSLVGLAGRL